jgi:mannosyl-oligosaccharide alpha-1,2-mannosidase
MARWSRRSFLLSSAAAAAFTPLTVGRAWSMPDPESIAQEVRAEFLHAWNGYRKFAWGHDEVKPVSGKPVNFFLDDHSFGLSIIEAMDTLYVMGLDAQLEECVRWIHQNLNFEVEGDVQMFEAVIRMVAGLMTGSYATGDQRLFERARELADRLLVCFTKPPTGAPYRFADLKTGKVSDPKSNLAEIGSNILEFGDLSRLTGDPKYLNASMKAYEAVIAKRSHLDLLGTNFDIETGEFMDAEDDAPDEPADSFYEYIWGGWQMFGDTRLKNWFHMLVEAMNTYKIVHVDGDLWYRPVNYKTGKPMGATVETELIAFWAEIVAKGGDREIGEAFYDSWTHVLDTYEMLPEEINFDPLSVVSARNELRPEYANAAFDLWFLTHDEKYRRTAYRYFQSLRVNCRTADGYTILEDVRTRPMKQGDYFPAYSFSENFKYLYLMFADSPRFDGAHYTLNTEGKIMRGLRG